MCTSIIILISNKQYYDYHVIITITYAPSTLITVGNYIRTVTKPSLKMDETINPPNVSKPQHSVSAYSSVQCNKQTQLILHHFKNEIHFNST